LEIVTKEKHGFTYYALKGTNIWFQSEASVESYHKVEVNHIGGNHIRELFGLKTK